MQIFVHDGSICAIDLASCSIGLISPSEPLTQEIIKTLEILFLNTSKHGVITVSGKCEFKDSTFRSSSLLLLLFSLSLFAFIFNINIDNYSWSSLWILKYIGNFNCLRAAEREFAEKGISVFLEYILLPNFLILMSWYIQKSIMRYAVDYAPIHTFE